MKRAVPAENPDAYVNALSGWQRIIVEKLRASALSCAGHEEVVKWGHLVYLSTGPAFLIRAEENRVLFGFWRGKRLLSIDKRLKPGGKYEMATIELHQGDEVSVRTARRLVKKAIELNRTLGNPTSIKKVPRD